MRTSRRTKPWVVWIVVRMSPCIFPGKLGTLDSMDTCCKYSIIGLIPSESSENATFAIFLYCISFYIPARHLNPSLEEPSHPHVPGANQLWALYPFCGTICTAHWTMYCHILAHRMGKYLSVENIERCRARVGKGMLGGSFISLFLAGYLRLHKLSFTDSRASLAYEMKTRPSLWLSIHARNADAFSFRERTPSAIRRSEEWTKA